ncbi:MAG: hypothetical protein WD377_05825 [Nitriliruptoraceae bacterium]
MTYRVGDEVDDDTFELRHVDRDVRIDEIECNDVLADGEFVDHLGDQWTQIAMLGHRTHVPGGQAVDIEQVGDEPVEPVAVDRQPLGQLGAPVVVDLRVVGSQGLDETDDRRQRCAQFV